MSSEKYKGDIQNFVRGFLLNESGELSLSNFGHGNNPFLLELLKKLDFLYQEGKKLVIKEEYENEILLYNINQKIPLAKLLENKVEDAIRGNIAEHYVLNCEKKRLGNEGNAIKVNMVSLQNAAAGYDVASFNSKESKDFDRFIEVKSGQFSKVHFFISKNEIKRAQQEKNNYWLYYVEMSGRKPIKLKMFQNPIETIIKNEKEYIVEYSQLEIRER